jgi:5-methyltetrahydropteroyltriglutamate--homocysteine methyltransferase
LNEIYTAGRWPRVVDKIEHRPLDYPKIWRMAQNRAKRPVKFGTCCSQVMTLFLDIHTSKYKDKREIVWDMAVAMNKELLALRDAGCKCIQIEEPCFHFMANTFGKDDSATRDMLAAYNREVEGLDDVELWIHTCWGNPNMQRVREDTSYAASMEMYLHEAKGDVWTVEMKDRNFKDIELFERFKDAKKKVAVGAVSHRTLQADRPEDVAAEIRRALKYIPVERLIVSSDCGFGRQGCNREIAFYKASSLAQGANIVRRELGLETKYIPAADAALQTDIVPKG